jgi:hypothetical protein
MILEMEGFGLKQHDRDQNQAQKKLLLDHDYPPVVFGYKVTL